jgi:hypothetical protein
MKMAGMVVRPVSRAASQRCSPATPFSTPKRIGSKSFRLEQGLHLCFCGLSSILSFTVHLGISKNKEITKIAPVLFDNPLCPMLTTLVIDPEQMECAIQAAVQVRPAKGADLPPAYRNLDFQGL